MEPRCNWMPTDDPRSASHAGNHTPATTVIPFVVALIVVTVGLYCYDANLAMAFRIDEQSPMPTWLAQALRRTIPWCNGDLLFKETYDLQDTVPTGYLSALDVYGELRMHTFPNQSVLELEVDHIAFWRPTGLLVDEICIDELVLVRDVFGYETERAGGHWLNTLVSQRPRQFEAQQSALSPSRFPICYHFGHGAVPDRIYATTDGSPILLTPRSYIDDESWYSVLRASADRIQQMYSEFAYYLPEGERPTALLRGRSHSFWYPQEQYDTDLALYATYRLQNAGRIVLRDKKFARLRIQYGRTPESIAVDAPGWHRTVQYRLDTRDPIHAFDGSEFSSSSYSHPSQVSVVHISLWRPFVQVLDTWLVVVLMMLMVVVLYRVGDESRALFIEASVGFVFGMVALSGPLESFDPETVTLIDLITAALYVSFGWLIYRTLLRPSRRSSAPESVDAPVLTSQSCVVDQANTLVQQPESTDMARRPSGWLVGVAILLVAVIIGNIWQSKAKPRPG